MGELQLPHRDNPLGNEEIAILSTFRDLGVAAGESVPTAAIGARMGRAGFLGGAQPWNWESAYVSLEVRGLIEPGADPFSAISWRLTRRGYSFVHAPGSELPDA